jgi:enamine deaminase RidA (YjgF/YER057c/UK114 family)
MSVRGEAVSIAPRDEPEAAEILAIREEEAAREGPTIVQPERWARPAGYTHGAVASGKIVTVAGELGWNPETCIFEAQDFAGQTRQALHNLVAVLLAAGARPHDLVRLTWYVVKRGEYVAAKKEIAEAYSEIIGDHYPPMSVVFVSGLLEQRAKVQIEGTAVIPDHP